MDTRTANPLHLIIPFVEFNRLIDLKVEQGRNLLNQSVNSNDDIANFQRAIKAWTDESLVLLSNSFSNPDNELREEFRYTGMNRFNLGGTPDLRRVLKQEMDTLREKQMCLYGIKQIVMVSDVIRNAAGVDLVQRASYSITEKLDLLLDKMYDLADNYNYSLRNILEGNGITFKQSDEVRGLFKELEHRDLIEGIGGIGDDIRGKITVKGRMYIEEKRKAYTESYDDINKSQEELNSKITEIITELKKHGYGQEVLFNELQELKELYSKLSKKNWGELVKGKLVDLAVSKLVDYDVLKFIYHALTSHDLRLP